MNRILCLALAVLVTLGASCSSDNSSGETEVSAAPDEPSSEPTDEEATPTAAPTPSATDAATDDSTPGAEAAEESTSAPTPSMFSADIWADNWFSLYVNGQLVGEDSVPITTERSFNAETIVFEASYPLTIAMVAKDFKETDSGLEYIGTDRQQVGDGGLIAQITDLTTGQVVAVTNGEWHAQVIHSGPTNDCVTSADPDTDCTFEVAAEPTDWTAPLFDDTAWPHASVYTAAQVQPKDGYDTVAWDPSAQLVWSGDLEIDNTVLLRYSVPSP